MFFAAAHPKDINVRQTSLDNRVSLVITGTMDGPQGVHRDIHHEVVYEHGPNGYKLKLIHFNTNQRLNYGSGWISDHYYMGDPLAATEPFSPQDVNLIPNFTDTDMDNCILVRFNGDNVGIMDVSRIHDGDKVRDNTIRLAFEGQLSDLDTSKFRPV